jgi:Nucleotide modification associated domain 2
MRHCSYAIVHDTGFAPNPFGGYCTLAACTPNHQGILFSRGDWLVGHATADRGHGMIYAMEMSEVLDFDTYYNDLRFEHEEPRFDQTWREACGDNIYHRAGDGAWLQYPTLFHGTPQNRVQDTRYPRVFISEHFDYFGENAPAIQEQFRVLVRDRQGCKCSYPNDLVKSFVEWLQANFVPGVRGKPRDLEWIGGLPNSPATQLYSLSRKPS